MKTLGLVVLVLLATAGCEDTRDADAGASVDAGPAVTDAGVADSGASDAGPDMRGIACSDAVCAAGSEKCCFFATGNTCHPVGEMCDGFPAQCDGPEDCPGTQACCALTGPARLECGEDCTPDEAACHTAADCRTGQDCCPSSIGLPPDGFCRDSC